MMPRVMALADDLTGALETASSFAAAGIGAVATMRVPSAADGLATGVPVLVIDTETRHLEAAAAAAIVRPLATAARQLAIPLLFKKTDSTLRGNIAAELGAVADAWPGTPVVYAPAYPRLGRTVRQGVLYVEGRAVGETAFSRDALNPVAESRISELLRAEGLALPILSVRPGDLGGPGGAAVYVVDGETEEQLESCAAEFVRRGLTLAAGPAGFARHLAAAIDEPRSAPPVLPPVRTCLVVNGSLHPAARSQIRRACAEGMPETAPSGAARRLSASGWAVLENPAIEASGLDYAGKLGAVVATVLAEAEPDAMVVFGGDTAWGILSALGGPLLRSLPEAAPGVPAASVDARDLVPVLPGRARDLLLVTKAGGFGTEDAVALIRKGLAQD